MEETLICAFWWVNGNYCVAYRLKVKVGHRLHLLVSRILGQFQNEINDQKKDGKLKNLASPFPGLTLNAIGHIWCGDLIWQLNLAIATIERIPCDSEDEESEDEGMKTTSVGSHAHRVILGLPPCGPLTLEDVKTAFRASALRWHPDRHPGSSQAMAEEKFKLCVNAYNSLCSVLKAV